MPLTQIAEGGPTPVKENDYFGLRTRKQSLGAPVTSDDFSGWGGPGSRPPSTAVTSGSENTPQTPSTPGVRLMGKLMSFGRGGKRQESEAAATASNLSHPGSENPAVQEVCIFLK